MTILCWRAFPISLHSFLRNSWPHKKSHSYLEPPERIIQPTLAISGHLFQSQSLRLQGTETHSLFYPFILYVRPWNITVIPLYMQNLCFFMFFFPRCFPTSQSRSNCTDSTVQLDRLRMCPGKFFFWALERLICVTWGGTMSKNQRSKHSQQKLQLWPWAFFCACIVALAVDSFLFAVGFWSSSPHLDRAQCAFRLLCHCRNECSCHHWTLK